MNEIIHKWKGYLGNDVPIHFQNDSIFVTNLKLKNWKWNYLKLNVN